VNENYLTIDHIGFVTHDIENAGIFFTTIAGFIPDDNIYDDVGLGARIRFYRHSSPSIWKLELIQPLTEDSPVARYAIQGGGPIHICYRIRTLEGINNWCRAHGVLLVIEPTIAKAYGDRRRVAFVFAQGLGLIEFVEYEDVIELPTMPDIFTTLRNTFTKRFKNHCEG